MHSILNKSTKNNTLSHFSFDGGNLTNQAGLLLFKELFTKLNLKEIISKHLVTDNKRCYYHYLDADIVIQFLWVIINLVFILVTVRIREFEDDDLVSPRTNQLMFIGLTGLMSIICLYRSITAGKLYQQLIAYIGDILCLIIMLFLIWGLKYYKK